MTIQWISALASLLLATAGWGAWLTGERFPHREHEKLFPTCEACHSGIASGIAEDAFPKPERCASCHNGTDVEKVAWSGPTHVPSNLAFSHVEHAAAADEANKKVTCVSCHQEDRGPGTPFMFVGRAAPQKCVACHESPEHLAENNACSDCHKPLARATELPDSVIAHFPEPRWHERADFVETHGRKLTDLSTCATCHTRESCARCHPNAASLPNVATLGSDARVGRLVAGKAPEYPTPASHRDDAWSLEHGTVAARAVERCANCHARSSCETCHQRALGSKAIQALPTAARESGSRASGPGVRLERKRVHPAGFSTSHNATAASERLTCTGCHEQRECQSCHEGQSGNRRFHSLAYMSKHAADAYGREKNCSSCHRTESFCRSCHVSNGMGTRGTASMSAHTGQPAWLLQHGEGARQGLESCTACHQQKDCVRCHSTLSWKVSPHGPNFDARRIASRNRQMCRVCHVGDPLR